jgi:hypothetical protein
MVGRHIVLDKFFNLAKDPHHFSHRRFGASCKARSLVTLDPVSVYDVYLKYVSTEPGIRSTVYVIIYYTYKAYAS